MAIFNQSKSLRCSLVWGILVVACSAFPLDVSAQSIELEGDASTTTSPRRCKTDRLTGKCIKRSNTSNERTNNNRPTQSYNRGGNSDRYSSSGNRSKPFLTRNDSPRPRTTITSNSGYYRPDNTYSKRRNPVNGDGRYGDRNYGKRPNHHRPPVAAQPIPSASPERLPMPQQQVPQPEAQPMPPQPVVVSGSPSNNPQAVNCPQSQRTPGDLFGNLLNSLADAGVCELNRFTDETAEELKRGVRLSR